MIILFARCDLTVPLFAVNQITNYFLALYYGLRVQTSMINSHLYPSISQRYFLNYCFED